MSSDSSAAVAAAQPASSTRVLHRDKLFTLPSVHELARWLRDHRAPDVKPAGAAYTDALGWLLTPTATYPGGHPEIKARNDVESTHGCSFDLDGPAGLDIGETLERVKRAGYAAVFWHSHSSTPEKPCGRLLVLHATCPADRHPAVYETLRRQLCPLAPKGQHNANRGWNLPRACVEITIVCDGPPVNWAELDLVELAARDRTPTPLPEPSATQRTEHDRQIVENMAEIWQHDTSGHYAWGALGGALCNIGVSEERAAWIAETLADAVATTHENPVARTLEAFDGYHDMGWPRLKEQLHKNGAGVPDDLPSEMQAYSEMPPLTAAQKIEVVLGMVETLLLASVAAPVPPSNDTTAATPATVAPAPVPAAPAPAALPALAAPKPPAPFFRTMSWSEISAPRGPVPWICEGLSIVKGRPTMIAGKPGSGKTWTAQGIGMAVATGTPVFGKFPVQQQGAVVHIDLDQGAYLTCHRYMQLALGLGVSDPPITLAQSTQKLTSDAAFKALLPLCQGKILCILDCLRNASGEDENSSTFAAPLNMLQHVGELTGCAFLVLHHTTKEQRSGIDNLRGTGAIPAAGGAVMGVELIDGRGPARVEFWRDAALGERPPPFSLELVREGGGALKDPETPVRLQWHSDDAQSAQGGALNPKWEFLKQGILSAVEERPGLTKTQLKETVKGDRQLFDKVLAALEIGTPECHGDRVWTYGPKKGCGYYPRSAADMLLAVLSDGETKPVVVLMNETRLPKGAVENELDLLRHRGHVEKNSFFDGGGSPAWQKVK